MAELSSSQIQFQGNNTMYGSKTEVKFDPITLKDGTQLPLINLKGKPYLQVAHRLVWFRKEHPTWTIKSHIVDLAEKVVLFEAEIIDEKGQLIANAHKRESMVGFADYIEKAQTGSIGRALALCGYGTQFEPELDEGERLADAPVDRATKNHETV